MTKDPGAIVAAAANHIGRVYPTTSAARALVSVAAKADLDICELAEALVLTGITKLGPFDLASLPNDLAVIQAVRTDDTLAREFITKEARRRPLGQVASILRCSSTWVRAAQNRWKLEMWPNTRRPLVRLPEEERFEELCSPFEIRDAITAAMKAQNGHINEAAWRLGVSHAWFTKMLCQHGRTPKPLGSGKATPLRLNHSAESTKEERARIRERINELGSVSAWARETGLHITTARKQASLCGYRRQRGDLSATTLSRLRAWIESTQYDGTTNAVGSAWLAKNVVLVDNNAYDKNRVQKAMHQLGFKAVMRGSSCDWVWVRNEKHVDKADPKFQFKDADRVVHGIWDLGSNAKSEKARIRAGILSGAIQPTPELLAIAGLQLR